MSLYRVSLAALVVRKWDPPWACPGARWAARLVDKWAQPQAATWAGLPVYKWVAWLHPVARWAELQAATWVALPAAKWAAWVHPVVRWVVRQAAAWVDLPAARWVAWVAQVDKSAQWLDLEVKLAAHPVAK